MQQGLLFAVAYGILGFAMAMGQEAVAQTTCTDCAAPIMVWCRTGRHLAWSET